MLIPDDDFAIRCLSRIGYYHLTPYWLPFREKINSETFNPGTNFSRVIQLYYFDRDLRLILLNGIESFEVAFKTVFANHLGCKYKNAFPHLDSSLFDNQQYFDEAKRNLIKEFEKSSEQFADHFRKKYSDILPPIWVSVEFMTFGALSKWYKNLKSDDDKEAIAAKFGLKRNIFETFVMSLALLRNYAAHQSRIWNRVLTKLPRIPNPKARDLYINLNIDATTDKIKFRKIYNTVVMLIYCLKYNGSSLELEKEIKNLMIECNIDAQMMGFPDDWKQRPLWKD